MTRCSIPVLTVALSTLGALICHAEDNRRNGNTWQTMDLTAKVNYIEGFSDGMELGHSYSIAQLIPKASTKPCLKAASESYESLVKRYMNNVTVEQIVEGLDTFYSDYGNRGIRLHHAAEVVVMPFGGVSRVDIEKFTDHVRAWDNQH